MEHIRHHAHGERELFLRLLAAADHAEIGQRRQERVR
jgi:hypothetical protein